MKLLFDGIFSSYICEDFFQNKKVMLQMFMKLCFPTILWHHYLMLKSSFYCNITSCCNFNLLDCCRKEYDSCHAFVCLECHGRWSCCSSRSICPASKYLLLKLKCKMSDQVSTLSFQFSPSLMKQLRCSRITCGFITSLSNITHGAFHNVASN